MLLTCNTIVQSFMLMVTMPLGGITGGTQTILGYNFGARRSDRVLAAQQYIVILSMAFTAVMFVIAQTVPHYFVQIFTRDPEYVELTVRAIRIFTLGIIPLAVQYEIVDGYTGHGNRADSNFPVNGEKNPVSSGRCPDSHVFQRGGSVLYRADF